jgi:hypothetical protein
MDHYEKCKKNKEFAAFIEVIIPAYPSDRTLRLGVYAFADDV